MRVSSVIDASIFLFAVPCLGVAMCARVFCVSSLGAAAGEDR